jgi:hypothetical protein
MQKRMECSRLSGPKKKKKALELLTEEERKAIMQRERKEIEERARNEIFPTVLGKLLAEKPPNEILLWRTHAPLLALLLARVQLHILGPNLV